MTQDKYENLVFFVTLANIVLGIVSTVLGTLAIVAIRHCNAVERALTKKEPSKELVPWDQRPQATLPQPRVLIRPSVLAQTHRRFQDDLWG